MIPRTLVFCVPEARRCTRVVSTNRGASIRMFPARLRLVNKTRRSYAFKTNLNLIFVTVEGVKYWSIESTLMGFMHESLQFHTRQPCCHCYGGVGKMAWSCKFRRLTRGVHFMFSTPPPSLSFEIDGQKESRPQGHFLGYKTCSSRLYSTINLNVVVLRQKNRFHRYPTSSIVWVAVLIGQ